MSAIEIARDSLRRHEGFRSKVYKCTAGKNTIGIGRNLDDRGITEAEAEYLLDNDIAECIQDLANFDYWNHLNDKQQAALIDLRFCLGAAGYRQFKRMNAALSARRYNDAALEIINSRFADQTGSRAGDLADMLVGVWAANL